jgi:hypothetical protein
MERQYVGIGFHRRRSVIVRLSAAGEKLSCVRVANDPLAIAAAVAEAGPDPERHELVESRMRGNAHVRFGRAGRGNGSRERVTPRLGPILTTGRGICCRPTAPGSIWPTRRASTGGSGG